MADFGGWQYPFQGQGSDPADSSPRDASPGPPVLEDYPDAPEPPSDPPTLHQFPQPPPAPVVQLRAIPQAPRRLYADSDYSFRKPIPPPKSREKAASGRSRRGSLATWDPPPLFQSYPQAIRHAQLPTCTTSVDTLLRVQESRHGFNTRELAKSDSTSTEDTGSVGEKLERPRRRRHRRTTSGSSMKLDWASKIYVLLASGHLLQYAAEGSSDRLPEKMLLLSKDSAAFASDIIPGRHWVLRVCSAMEVDGSPAGDSRSLRSRLPFRGSERRDASTFLMVFECAEDMESWITTLRREIEHLGGKKSLSETGTPKPEYAVAEQQTVAARDPERFSRVTSDDVSTTNSVYSRDSRQLSSLRDSDHRYSCISSGQRTMFTSDTGSSPPCSPARDSFISSPSEEQLASWNDSPGEAREARPRPNASAINERRQSLQAIAAHHRAADLHAVPQAAVSPVEIASHDSGSPCLASLHLPQQQLHITHMLREVHTDRLDHQAPSSPSPTVPNFSVPHSSKRFSGVIKTPCPDIILSPGLPLPLDVEPASQQQHQPSPHEKQSPSTSPPRPPQERKQQHYSPFPSGVRNNTRKLPPPALAYSRPLSVVPDQPSPVTASSLPLSCEKSAARADDRNVSSVSYSAEAYEAPRVPRAGSGRASTSSQHSGSSNGPISKSRVSIKDRLTRGSSGSSGSSTRDDASVRTEKTTKKRSGLQALRTSLAAKISNAVMSDSMSFGVPYSAALPMPLSQIPVQYRPQLLLQKAASAADKAKEAKEASSAHEIVLKAKIDNPIREACAVEGTVYTPTRASAPLVQIEYAEEAPLLDSPPQLPQMQPMPPMPPLPRLSQLPVPHGKKYIPHPTAAGQCFQRQRESSHTHATVQPKHRQPWDDMGIPVYRPPMTCRPMSPASGMASYATMDAGIDRDHGHGSSIHPEHSASRPTTPQSLGQSGHSLARSVSSNVHQDPQNMPRAADGPPPAPPPTCTLPPLPPKVPKLDMQQTLET